MRRIVSSGSVRAIWLDSDLVIQRLKRTAEEACRVFPEIMEVRFFGSMAKGEETGLSDADIFIMVTDDGEENPIERMKPYFSFFSDRLDIAIDMIVATKTQSGNLDELLADSKLLCCSQ
jgi:uncharacterized protein